MVGRRSRVDGQRGVTLAELITIVAIIGIVSVGAIPMFLSFVRASETRGASQELATILQHARELAITRNTNYTVQIDVIGNGNRLRFVDGVGTPWTGPGTDGNGYMRLTNGAQLFAKTADPVFNPLGDAGAERITVRNAQGSSAQDVVVSFSGRIRIAAVGQ